MVSLTFFRSLIKLVIKTTLIKRVIKSDVKTCHNLYSRHDLYSRKPIFMQALMIWLIVAETRILNKNV